MGSLWDIGRKQLEDTFSSKKFLLILGLFLALSLGSVYVGFQEYQQAMERFLNGDVYGEIPEKPSLIEVFGPMVGLNLPLAAGVLALLLSYDVISGEREEGTIELLLSYPVYRDEVITGKFVAGLFTVSVALLLSFTASSGLAIYLTGRLPTMQQVYRLLFMWHGSIVYMAFFFGVGTLFSAVFRSRWRSLIAGFVVLGVFLATPFLASFAATQLYPMPEDGGGPGVPDRPGGPVAYEVETTARAGTATGEVEVRPAGPGIPRRPGDDPGGEKPGGGRQDDGPSRREVLERRQRFTELVSRVSPVTSYRNYLTTMLGTEYEGKEQLKPTVMDSLRSAGGYIVFLLSEAMLVFTLAYAVFMRQDL